MKTTAKSLLKQIIESLIEVYDHGESEAIGKILLEDIIGVPAHRLPLNPNLDLSNREEDTLSDAIVRLKKHEPIQYVTGKCHFYGREFNVNPGVLIPRPETEELIALILSEYQTHEDLMVVDIGTGSGCIAISLAAELSSAEVTAIDISEQALAVAVGNARLNKVSLQTKLLDITAETLNPEKYDLIVSNPPYITASERSLMHENVLAHEPSLALFVPNEDPLKFYDHIARLGQLSLNPNGRIYCEINEHYGAETVSLFEQYGYHKVSLHKDMQGKDRIISCEKA